MYAFENKYDDDFLIFYYYNTDYYQLRMDRSIDLDIQTEQSMQYTR